MTPQDTDELSDEQVRRLSLMPMTMAPFSVMAGSLVLFGIYRRKLYRFVYGRCMIGLASYIILTMTWWGLGPLLVVKEVDSQYAHGTTQTCTMGGFFTHIGYLGVIMYNHFLMTIFLLTVRSRLPIDAVKQHVERWFYIIAFVLALIAGVSGLILDAYNPVSVGFTRCMIWPYPSHCDGQDVPCERGQHATKLLIATIIVPVFLLFVSSNICIFSVFRTAYQRRRNARLLYGRFNNSSTLKRVERQALLYAAYIFLTQIIALIMPILQATMGATKNGNYFYPGHIILENLCPLQGVFCLLIFLYPRYSELASKNTDLTRLRLLQLAIFSSQTVDEISMESKRARRHSQSSMMFSPSGVCEKSNEAQRVQRSKRTEKGDGISDGNVGIMEENGETSENEDSDENVVTAEKEVTTENVVTTENEVTAENDADHVVSTKLDEC